MVRVLTIGRRRQGARFLLVGLASIVLVVAAFNQLSFAQRISRSNGAAVDSSLHRMGIFDCMTRQVRDRVPAGATVNISREQPVDPDLWYQRLVEMTYPYARVVDDPRDASFDVGVGLVAPQSGCEGLEVTVVPRS